MAFSQADLDALDNAIKQGVRIVEYGDKKVTYHSLDEMMRLRSTMQTEIANASGTQTSRARFGSFSKG